MNERVKVFDYITLSKRYGIEPGDLKKIVDEVHNEFKDDEMMTELHIVRAIRQAVLKSKQGALI
jgi:hypothetical protein